MGEHIVKVDQALIGMKGSSPEQIKKVYSHQQGILQCREFLEKYPNMQAIEYDSTSAGVEKVAKDQDPTQAAISSVRAAKLYNLAVLQEQINQQSNNSTRFIIVTKKNVYCKNGKKISICFEVKHESGTLYNMLANFMFSGLNLTQIESRPIENKKWEYRFFVELEGNLDSASVQNALRAVKQEATAFRLFGCF